MKPYLLVSWIIGIFDQLNSVAFPTTHPQMAIAVQLVGQPGHIAPVEVAILSPDGKPVVHMPTQNIALSTEGKSFVQLGLLGARFNAPGDYDVVVRVSGEVAASQTLKVRKVQVQTA